MPISGLAINLKYENCPIGLNKTFMIWDYYNYYCTCIYFTSPQCIPLSTINEVGQSGTDFEIQTCLMLGDESIFI